MTPHKFLIAQKFDKSYGGEIFAKDMSHAQELANLINAEVVGMITEEAPERVYCHGCLTELFTYCPMCSGEMDEGEGH